MAARSSSFSLFVVGGGVLGLVAYLADAGLYVELGAAAVDEGCVVLVGDDATAGAEVGDHDRIEAATRFATYHLAAEQNGHIVQNCLAPLAEGWGLDGDAVERAAQVVDDQRGERFALDVLGDDDQISGHLRRLLQ